MEKVFKLMLRMPNFAVLLPLTMRTKRDKVPLNQRKKKLKHFFTTLHRRQLTEVQSGLIYFEGRMRDNPDAVGPKGVGSDEGDYPISSLL